MTMEPWERDLSNALREQSKNVTAPDLLPNVRDVVAKDQALRHTLGRLQAALVVTTCVGAMMLWRRSEALDEALRMYSMSQGWP